MPSLVTTSNLDILERNFNYKVCYMKPLFGIKYRRLHFYFFYFVQNKKMYGTDIKIKWNNNRRLRCK